MGVVQTLPRGSRAAREVTILVSQHNRETAFDQGDGVQVKEFLKQLAKKANGAGARWLKTDFHVHMPRVQ